MLCICFMLLCKCRSELPGHSFDTIKLLLIIGEQILLPEERTPACYCCYFFIVASSDFTFKEKGEDRNIKLNKLAKIYIYFGTILGVLVQRFKVGMFRQSWGKSGTIKEAGVPL